MDYTKDHLLRNVKEAAAQYGRSAAQLSAFNGKTSGEGAKRLKARMDEALNINDYATSNKERNAPSKSEAIKAWNSTHNKAASQAMLTQTNASDRFGKARKTAIAKKLKK
jgi:hypothetical protein